ncbi:leucine-rich repeat and coiled-coil domain-containing protein PF3D7_0703800-like isoform X2 [Dreissena polymorpha]|uniref:leucine-rich repeat and coiled-coil domain-containing protein PF3D7_0703800-like isoform X2 n=1 Tax=Dreissena polymorpha TaxID=45954 RepID=UPI002264058F|nr:leucine-rich repeat and coiled-coil domain-containing protein PF3D7_0703800-like isoform X2 [Dreissena polymorpha]
MSDHDERSCLCRHLDKGIDVYIRATASRRQLTTYIQCNTGTDSNTLHEMYKDRVARTLPNLVKMAEIPEKIRLLEEKRGRAAVEREEFLHRPDLDRKLSILSHMHHGDDENEQPMDDVDVDFKESNPMFSKISTNSFDNANVTSDTDDNRNIAVVDTDKGALNYTNKIAADDTNNIADCDTNNIAGEDTDKIAAGDTNKIDVDDTERIASVDPDKITEENAKNIAANDIGKIVADDFFKIAAEDNDRYAADDIDNFAADIIATAVDEVVE